MILDLTHIWVTLFAITNHANNYSFIIKHVHMSLISLSSITVLFKFYYLNICHRQYVSFFFPKNMETFFVVCESFRAFRGNTCDIYVLSFIHLVTAAGRDLYYLSSYLKYSFHAHAFLCFIETIRLYYNWDNFIHSWHEIKTVFY